MTWQEVLLAVLLASMTIAVWGDARLGDRSPGGERSPASLAVVIGHCVGAFAIVKAAGILGAMAIDPSSLPRITLALLLIVLPGWVYAFLATIWMLKLAASAISR